MCVCAPQPACGAFSGGVIVARPTPARKVLSVITIASSKSDRFTPFRTTLNHRCGSRRRHSDSSRFSSTRPFARLRERGGAKRRGEGRTLSPLRNSVVDRAEDVVLRRVAEQTPRLGGAV